MRKKALIQFFHELISETAGHIAHVYVCLFAGKMARFLRYSHFKKSKNYLDVHPLFHNKNKKTVFFCDRKSETVEYIDLILAPLCSPSS